MKPANNLITGFTVF